MHDKEKLKIQRYIRGCGIVIFGDEHMTYWEAEEFETEIHEIVFTDQFKEYCRHTKKKDKKKW